MRSLLFVIAVSAIGLVGLFVLSAPIPAQSHPLNQPGTSTAAPQATSTAGPEATVIPTVTPAPGEPDRPECSGLFPYSVQDVDRGVYWAFSMNFVSWTDAQHPLGCVVVYGLTETHETYAISSVPVSSCEVLGSGSIPTKTVASPFTIIPSSTPTLTVAQFDGTSYIKCRVRISEILDSAMTQYDLRVKTPLELNVKRMPVKLPEKARQEAAGDYIEYPYFAMGGFGRDVGQGRQPLLYYQPVNLDCLSWVANPRAAGQIITQTVSQVVTTTACMPISLWVHAGDPESASGRLRATVNGHVDQPRCYFPPRPPQHWNAGLHRGEFGYYQYDYESLHEQICSGGTRKSPINNITAAYFWIGDADIYIGGTPLGVNGPMFVGELYQVVIDPTGDNAPPGHQ
jgi:hypothetical protein